VALEAFGKIPNNLGGPVRLFPSMPPTEFTGWVVQENASRKIPKRYTDIYQLHGPECLAI
jgi:hypothetical protein